jgi:hypothetical protein
MILLGLQGQQHRELASALFTDVIRSFLLLARRLNCVQCHLSPVSSGMSDCVNKK